MSNTKNETTKPILGEVLILASLLITSILWILSKPDVSEIWQYPILSLNQITALLGTILFSWSLFLATRLDLLERLFGGLDRVYHIHRRVSEIGSVLILLHPIFLILNRPDYFAKYLLPIHGTQAINLGVYSFWIFVATILLTLFVHKLRIPYHLWKHTHKFLNLAMILALIHVALVKSDVSIFPILGYWMDTFIAMGVASGIYKTVLYGKFGPRYSYKIKSIKTYGGVYDIRLEAQGAPLSYNLAQFAYVAFDADGVSKESHPYCITSLPEEKTLRFCIKELGDYTKTLDALNVGGNATVWGAHGKLGKRFDAASEDAVFVAGGIGIAPFLSMFKRAKLEKKTRDIALFYCTKYRDDAVFEPELKSLRKGKKTLFYHNQCSREKGGCHLSAKDILKQTKTPATTVVYLCGPKRMMSGLSKELVAAGFKKENIIFEDFEML